MAVHPKSLQRFPFSRVAAVLLLLLLLVIGAVPGYLTGQWVWVKPPLVTTLKQLKAIRDTGLTIPGWQTSEHRVIEIGGHRWLAQQIQQNADTKAILLLLPQNGHTDQPEVEWMDINGAQRWDTDSERSLDFTAQAPASGNAPTNQPTATVKARFFRGWTSKQTYAVLQWYATPTMGTPTPARWFITDRLAQLQKRRVPWIAVSVLMLIEPLEEIEKYESMIRALGQAIQGQLMASPLAPS